MVHGDLAGGNLAYAAGVFNGVVDGGSGDTDIQDGKDFVGRVFLAAVPRAPRQPLAGARRRDRRELRHPARHLRRQQCAPRPSERPARTSFFAFRGDDPVVGPVLADGTHTRISAQGHYYLGAFGLLGEHVLSSQEIRRGTADATLDNSAWQVAGSWVLTGEATSYRGVVPRSSLRPHGQHLGRAGADGALHRARGRSRIPSRSSPTQLPRRAAPTPGRPASTGFSTPA